MGDVNADGSDDIIVGRGRGGLPEVRVYSGKDFSLLRSFNAYAAAFAGGDPQRSNTIVGEAVGLIGEVRPAAGILEAMTTEAEALLAGGWRH